MILYLGGIESSPKNGERVYYRLSHFLKCPSYYLSDLIPIVEIVVECIPYIH